MSVKRSGKRSTTRRRWRVVVDTNVFVSGLLGGANAKVVIDALRGRKFRPVFSQLLLKELRRVVARPDIQRRVRPEAANVVFRWITRRAVFPSVQERIDACRDPKDNEVLEAAVAGRANMIVTGDNDLLELHPFRGIEILTLAAFVNRLTDEKVAR